jgi:ABC-type Mn2+/Zn2+ transport system ATPase subunit
MDPIVRINKLTISFNGIPVLEDITFDIERGDIVAIIGPNGAGKSTLVKAIMGLISTPRGNILLRSNNLKRQFPTLSYVPQRYQFDKSLPITVGEFLALSLNVSSHKDGEVDDSLSHVDMLEKKYSLLGSLSGGELQKVLIARAIITHPELIIFDEAEANIDISGSKRFLDIVEHLHEKHKTTIIMVSHEVDFVYRYATKVLCLNKTIVCYGLPSETLEPHTLHRLYGENMGSYKHFSPK